MYALTLVAGIFLVRGAPLGWFLSKIVLALQVLRFQIFDIGYTFSLGGSLLIFQKGQQTGVSFHFGNEVGLGWGYHDSTFFLGLNLFAVSLISALRELERRSSAMGAIPFQRPV
jgi:hypothetical protein